MAYSQGDNQEFNVEATLQTGDLEGLLDAIANALIQSPLINPSDVENNQKFIRNGQIQIGQGEGFLALYQKDVEANVEDDLQSVADSISGLFQINIQEGVDSTVSVNVSGGGLPAGGQDITNLVFGENNPLNVSQFIPLQLSSSLVDIEKAEEFLDTNIFELLPSGDARQARIVRFFQELNALLPPTPPQFDLDGNGKVDRGMDNSWTGSLQYSKDNSISYAQDNTDGNIDEEDAFIHRLKSTSNDTNSSRTIEDIYNRVLPYLTDRLEDSGIDEDGRPVYENQSSGYLKFRNLNQGIIIRNTNQDFIEGLNPNNLNYLNTDGTGGFTITMWVRFLDKVSEGTLFNFGNPTRDENPFGFKLETFVLNKNDNTLYPPDYDPNGSFTTWGSTVENTTDLKNQGIFSNSNTARFVRLQVRDGDEGFRRDVRDSHVGNNSIRKISWSYPDFRYRDGIENSMSLRLINSTFIPENFNEWYFICASYNPNVIEPRRYGDGTNDIEPDIYNDYKSNQNFWLNHVDPLNNGSFTNFSNYGNKCKVEIISKSQLLRARGFKV
tara:strand:- start:9057 stop:10715 length:1659 start_codon:yes stop_codon:yes gene_type:complete